MNDLVAQKILAFCSHVPIDLVKAIADRLCSMDSDINIRKIHIDLGLNVDIIKVLDALLKCLSPKELATLLSIGVAFQQKEKENLFAFVWSGPTYELEARQTEQVILDIIDTAEKELLLVSFAAYKVPVLLEAIQNAICRGVRVRFILETEEDSDGRLNFDTVKTFSTLHGVEVYHWPKEQREVYAPGKHPVMHAKCVVTEKEFLISSANLTENAITSNMELGVHVGDYKKSNLLINQFNSLISSKILVSLSA